MSDITVTPELLDTIEELARYAGGEAWGISETDGLMIVADDREIASTATGDLSGDGADWDDLEDKAKFIARMDPPTTLALITRIRDEETQACAAVFFAPKDADRATILNHLAALPRLGEPVAWRADIAHGQGFTGSKAMAEDWAKNTTVTPLYLAPPAPALPEGWKVAPVIATTEMLEAGRIRERQWSRALDAAPEPPSSVSESPNSSAPAYQRPSRNAVARDERRRLAMVENLIRLKTDFSMRGANASTIEAIINYLRDIGLESLTPAPNSQGSLDGSEPMMTDEEFNQLVAEVGQPEDVFPYLRVPPKPVVDPVKAQLVEALRTLIFVCDDRWEGKFPEAEVDAARAALAAAEEGNKPK